MSQAMAKYWFIREQQASALKQKFFLNTKVLTKISWIVEEIMTMQFTAVISREVHSTKIESNLVPVVHAIL
jgi:hypothetical protein